MICPLTTTVYLLIIHKFISTIAISSNLPTNNPSIYKKKTRLETMNSIPPEKMENDHVDNANMHKAPHTCV